MRIAFSLTVLCLLSQSTTSQAEDRQVEHRTTGTGVEFGIWGDTSHGPAPTLFVLAGTIDGTLGSSYFRQCGNELAQYGFICVSVDLPCHGTQSAADEPGGLNGWSYRAARKQDFVSASNRRLSDVLDFLIKHQLTDPEKVAACGTSRGGFAAIHFAAADRRIRAAAGFAPVTDLDALREFEAIRDDAFVARLALSQQAQQLAGRPVWIVIGDQDQRVGTDRAMRLAQELTQAAVAKQLESRVALHVLAEPRGHTTPEGSSRLAADWILKQLKIEAPDSESHVSPPTVPQPAKKPLAR